MTPDDEQKVIYRFFTEVGIIQQLMDTKLESILPGRMSSTQFGILGHLCQRSQGETPLQLSNAFQVPKTSMTHMLVSLEKKSLISIEPNPVDGRSKVACATKTGHTFLQESVQQIGKDLSPVLAELSTKPFREALPNLQRIREALDQERDKND